jgi:hypothetical protein
MRIARGRIAPITTVRRRAQTVEIISSPPERAAPFPVLTALGAACGRSSGAITLGGLEQFDELEPASPGDRKRSLSPISSTLDSTGCHQVHGGRSPEAVQSQCV